LLAQAVPEVVTPIDAKALLDYRDQWRRKVAQLV
jgi:hypothetical protein